MQLFKNNAYSTVAASLASGGLTLTVATGHGDRFPVVAGADFALVTLQDASNNIEIVKVTARGAGSDAMTIVRAQEGTTARAWNIGDIVELRLTAAGLAPLQVYAGAATAAAMRAVLDVPTRTGGDASGTWGINITGNADGNAGTATKLATARALTIGDTAKNFDGSAAVSWTIAEIGAADKDDTVNLTGNQTVAGVKTFSSAPTVAGINGGQLAGLRSPLINGLFAINQRAPASNADDTYAHDRWYALTQTGAIALSTLTDVEDGTPFMARLTQSQASAQRMGYAQIIEGKNCKHLRGKQVTFRFGRTRLSASANVRFAVLEWTGTEDAVTSDVVNDWTSASYAAGGFFLAANLTVSGVVQQAMTANTLADGSAVTVTLGSTFNNLIVMAWTEGTVAQNVTFDLGLAQLEVGAVATPFEHRPVGLELALCQRYYEKSYNSAVVPGSVTNDGALQSQRAQGAAVDEFAAVFMVAKRATPTVTTYSTNSGAVGKVFGTNGSDLAANFASTGQGGYTISVSISNAEIAKWHHVASSEL